MRRRSVPLVVGIVTVIGIGLTVALLLALGSGRLFRDRTRAVAFFEESVNGLHVGGDVKFRGITVGRVVAMRIDWSAFDQGDAEVPIEVVLELDEGWAPHGWTVEALVDRGLRAQLGLESLLTNVRYLSLDFRPDVEPAGFVGHAAEYPAIPTTPTDVAMLQEQTRALLAELAEIDYRGLAESVSRLADQVRAFVENPIDLGAIMDPGGGLARQLRGVLEEIERSARSVRQLADQLSRDPGALIRGGGGSQ